MNTRLFANASPLDGYLVIGICCFLAFFLNIWGYPLFDLDEGAFAEATREMLATGNFAATYLDGNPRYDKPILSYWFQAISVSLFGINEFAFRLPSAIASTLWLLASYLFTRQQWNETTAIITVIIMANTLWIGFIGRAAIADAWLNLFVCLAIFDIWRYWQKTSTWTLVRVFVWMGLGVLTKGPIAIAIPLLTSGMFFVIHGQWRRWLSAIFNPLGWLAIIAILLPWGLMVYLDQGWEFFQSFLLEHNLRRFMQTREGHGGSIFYYFVALPLIILPFTGVFFKTLWHGRQLWQNHISQYLLLWACVVFVLVSVSQTQLPHYVLYGVTGLTLVFAHHRDILFSGRWQSLFPIVFFLVLLFLPQILMFAAEQSSRAYERELLAQSKEILGWEYSLLAFVALSLTLIIAFWRDIGMTRKLLTIGFIQTLFVFNVLIPVAAELLQIPVKTSALIAKSHQDKSAVSYGLKMPSFSVYREAVTPRSTPEPGNLIFTRADRLSSLEQKIGNQHLKVLYRQGGILLLEYLDDK